MTAPPDAAPPRSRVDVRRRALGVLLVLALAVVGGLAGVRLVGPTSERVGPLDVDVALGVGWGSTVVDVPPLGTLTLDSHTGPLRLDVRVEQLRAAEARALAGDPRQVAALPQTLPADLASAVRSAALRSGLAFLAGAGLAAYVVTRRRRRVLQTTATAAVLLAGSGTWAVTTVDRGALAEPDYSGILASAPALIGDLPDVQQRYDTYRLQLTRLVDNVTSVYSAGAALPEFRPTPDTVRVLFVSDHHLNPAGFDLTANLASQFDVDLVVDGGDSTDWGTPAEARVAAQTRRVDVPYLWVRGNHDSVGVQRAMEDEGVVVLEGEAVEVEGLRILGDEDPRFTPDASTRGSPEEERAAVAASGRRLAQTAARDAAAGAPPDIVVVHDPAAARELVGSAPLVLGGHRHRREVSLRGSTVVFEQGSTGGAGIRGLQDDEPTPLTASVLYLDRATGALLAWDDVTVGGLGDSSVSVSRSLPESLTPQDGVQGGDAAGAEDAAGAAGAEDATGSEDAAAG